ncbi:hypothetical protein BO71DRAFT_389567 [Aspergillus ellipticus CBS 707.79]|uniref:Zn(2)-C6 fungal-type domain-containing protein n=1 Tax=Aspergillus ellipticus CBS 707.79 TaxID=1448320 RepID=A0A319DN16_9EURO|nr:hypothetical protein BO71DRAFT_389567 [Aspergillus ellipticus CBS 707.79]
MSPTGPENGATAPVGPVKPRSCLVCRQRKVRCDKQSPCSNCRRGKVACVSPAASDRPPRWARRLDPPPHPGGVSTGKGDSIGVDQLRERLHSLESLVQELRGQLGSSPPNSNQGDQASDTLSSRAGTNSVQTQFGRLVLQGDSHSRYVSGGFWSRVNDELNGLKVSTNDLVHDDSDSADDEAPPAHPFSLSEVDRTATERHAFLFGLNLHPSTPNLRELHPLPSQIPFLLETFTENINAFLALVHMPTVSKVVRDWRSSGMKSLTTSNEALLFSIYYATIASMEEEDVMTNFGASKSDLNLKYRTGLEHALAKSDFLNAPDLVLVQAFTIFLFLSRRYDSPRFIWMMTGFVIRMAHYLGLQRDGANFPNFTPYEVEIRRRAWWGVCLLDIRASEDQGTDLTITPGSFDTKLPLNINDADISPETKVPPPERQGMTDMSIPRLSAQMTTIMRQMTVRGMDDGVAGMQAQSQLVDELYHTLDKEYLQHTATEKSPPIVAWVAVHLIRMVMAKMTLIVFLPVLFASPSGDLSDAIRTKLLGAATEVAEYNHALNAEPSGRHLRWLYQTCTHWHAIVYILIEIARRPWSAAVERAWIALHSPWLIPPAPSPIATHLRIWVPLRKLMEKARRHRETQIQRLQRDPEAVEFLEKVDRETIPIPSSPGLLEEVISSSPGEAYRHRWQQLVAPRPDPISTRAETTTGHTNPTLHNQTINPNLMTNTITPPTTVEPLQDPSATLSGYALDFNPASWPPTEDLFQGLDIDWSDANMDPDGDMDWHGWIESAKGMQ